MRSQVFSERVAVCFTDLALLQQLLAEFQDRGDAPSSGSHLQTQRLEDDMGEERKRNRGQECYI